MAITAADVNKLRQMTGAGMMDCKKALVEADGDFDAAIDILRKKGQQVAAKRADRASSEGRAVAKVNADKTFAAVVVIGCETDFVGKNSDFVEFADSIIDAAIENKVRDIDALNALTIDGSTVAEMILQMTGKTGEKVELAALP
jgi:elongation factor Ts